MYTPGLWLHEWRPIQFSLVVDDFGVKYVGEENAKHLVNALVEHYEISQDWDGKNIADLPWNGSTKRENCTYTCRDMSKTRPSDSSTTPPRRDRTNPIHTLHLNMGQN